MLPDPVEIPRQQGARKEQEPDPHEAENASWWEDETNVPRSSPGKISPLEAEARVLRALRTMRSISFAGPSYKTNADVLARAAATSESFLLEDAADVRHDWRPRFEPSGSDLDDFLTASRWFQSLHSPDERERRPGRLSRAQIIILLRSANPPWSWAAIGDRWGISGQRAQQIYQSAVVKIWRAANECTQPPLVSAKRQPKQRFEECHVHLD